MSLFDHLRPSRWPQAVREAASFAQTLLIIGVVVLIPRIVLAEPFTIPSASMEPTVQKGDYILVSKFAYGWSGYSVQAGTFPYSPAAAKGRVMARTPTRGDVVVFSLPRDDHEVYIKRLIGLPGDTLQVKRGVLFVNGQRAAQQRLADGLTTCPGYDYGRVEAPRYLESLPGGRAHPIAACADRKGPANNTAVFRVPAGCYFMMGDNRDNSIDSRFAPLGGRQSEAAESACPFDSDLSVALGDDWNGVGFVPADHLVGKAEMVLVSWSEGAALTKPWTWVANLQPGRFFRKIS